MKGESNWLVMLTVAAIVSLCVGIWEDNSDSHPADEPKVGWYIHLQKKKIFFSYPNLSPNRVDGVAILGAVAVVVVTSKQYAL